MQWQRLCYASLAVDLTEEDLALGAAFLVASFLAVEDLVESLAAGLAAFALAGAFFAAAALGFTEDVRLRVAFLGFSTTGGL